MERLFVKPFISPLIISSVTEERHSIGIIAGIIVGMDNDDVRVFENMFEFLQETGIQAIQVNIMTSLPGMPMYDYNAAGWRIIEHDSGHYDFRHCVFDP